MNIGLFFLFMLGPALMIGLSAALFFYPRWKKIQEINQKNVLINLKKKKIEELITSGEYDEKCPLCGEIVSPSVFVKEGYFDKFQNHFDGKEIEGQIWLTYKCQKCNHRWEGHNRIGDEINDL